MHYRLLYRQLIIEEISVLTIVIEPLRADGEQEASLVLVPPVSGEMQAGRSASLDAERPACITTQSVVTSNHVQINLKRVDP